MANKSKALSWGSKSKGSVAGTTMFITDPGRDVNHEWIEPSEIGMIGTDRPANLGRQVGKIDVKLNPVVQPSYANANLILQTWFDETTGTFTPADAPGSSSGAMVYDFDGAAVLTYAACWLQELEITGEENNPLDWILHLLGTTEATSGSVTALTLADRMMMDDMTFVVDSDNYFPTGFAFRFGYQFEERFLNSQTRASVSAHIPYCEIDLNLDLNADSYAGLYALAGTDTAVGGTNGVILTATDGTYTMVITVDEMTVMNASPIPNTSGADAQQGTVTLKAWLKSGSTDIVVITYA